jgi:small subunit ribosomal protein S1
VKGDTVDVLLERTEDRDGHIVLSREKAEKMKIWDEVERAFVERKVVIGRVVERIKGGLAVDIGVRAFLPGSQIDVRPVRNLDALKGQELRMRVIKVNKKRGNIVLSRKVLLEEENAEKKKTTLETLAEGKVLRGVVKNITDYGAFIDLGGIDGLLHITDMSWGRVGHPSELFKVNDEIDVVVLKYDAATERVSLGHKQLVIDPWTTVMDRFPVGRASAARWSASPTTAPSSSSSRVSRASSTSARCRGASGSSTRRRSSTSATRSRHWCSASIRPRAASRSASSRSRATPGTS